jgi:hypothetical protein
LAADALLAKKQLEDQLAAKKAADDLLEKQQLEAQA